MADLPLFAAAASAVVVVLGLLSRAVMGRWPVSEALLALAAGVALGPLGLGAVDGQGLGLTPEVVEQAARYTLGAALIASAFELPPDLFRHWRAIAALLGLGMPGMWLVTALLAWLILDVPAAHALVLGAALAPTDPVLAGGILNGNLARRAVPAPMRTVMVAESGANDGLALPFVVFSVALLNGSAGEAGMHTLVHGIGWQVLGGGGLGVAIGWLAGRALRFAQRRLNAGGAALHAALFALAALILLVGHALKVDAILSVFLGGLAFAHTARHAGDDNWRGFTRATKRFLELPLFLGLGIVLPVQAWLAAGPALAVFAVAVLLLRRMPLLWALRRLVPELRRPGEVWFAGWFGPMGTAALFYAMMAERKAGDELAWTVVSAIVTTSIVIHGVTATPWTQRLGKERT